MHEKLGSVGLLETNNFFSTPKQWKVCCFTERATQRGAGKDSVGKLELQVYEAEYRMAHKVCHFRNLLLLSWQTGGHCYRFNINIGNIIVWCALHNWIQLSFGRYCTQSAMLHIYFLYCANVKANKTFKVTHILNCM